MANDAVKVRPSAVVAAVLIGLSGTVVAQESTPRWYGTIGAGATLIEEDGARSLVRERADLFEGLSLRQTELHGLVPGNVRIDFYAPRIDPVARDARLLVTSPRASGSVRTASNEFIYDPQGALTSQREQLTADLRLRPLRQLELFGEHARFDLGGRRQAIVPGDEGELGTSWDQDTASWRGGLRLMGLRSTLELASIGRRIESRSVPAADRQLHGFETTLRSHPHPRVDAEGIYAWSRTRLLADGTPIESDRLSGFANFEVRPGLRVGPVGRVEESTDRALGVRSNIWAVGGAVRAAAPRFWGDLEGEWGRRDTNVGDSDVWGVRASGAAEIRTGVRLQGLYQRVERDRQDVLVPVGPAAPLPDLVGNLEVQRIEGRLRLRGSRNGTLDVLVGRFDKDYRDVQVAQQIWRYGLQGSSVAAQGLRLEAGWRLDDLFDLRTTGRYVLRVQTFFGGAELTRFPKLLVRVRADTYSMQRSLDEWKFLLNAAADYEVLPSTFLGLEYGHYAYDENLASTDYRSNVWSFVVRRGFAL